MKYISATKGAVMVLPIFVVLALVIPKHESLPSVELILTISTFLFAIISGFYISRLATRYDQIRNLIASEDASFLCLYKTAQMFGSTFAKRMANLMDAYYIVSYDHSLSDPAYKQSAKYYLALWDEVRTVKKKEPAGAYEAMMSQLVDIEKDRNASAAIASERLSPAQWGMLILLSVIILVSVFDLIQPHWYIQFSVVLFSAILVLILLLTRDLQKLMIGGKALLEESGQEVLEFIGKKRYYHQKFVQSGISRVPSFVKEYRLGLHEPGADAVKMKRVKNNNRPAVRGRGDRGEER